MSKTPLMDMYKKYPSEWQSWRGMKERCKSKAHDHYKNYGGRGITVCEEWSRKGGFISFLEHMGPKPGKGYSIDRIDNDGNYEPGNCRWVSQKEQLYNSTVVKKVTINGVTDTLGWHIKNNGISNGLYYQRRNRGMSVEEAITSPKIREDYLEAKRQKRINKLKSCKKCGKQCKTPAAYYCSNACYVADRWG